MNFLEYIKGAVRSVLCNKMRSFLTMLGIIIGISSVITIVSIGEGGSNYISTKFENIGSNSLTISIKSKPYEIIDNYYFTKKDINAINDKIDDVKVVSPFIQAFGNISYNGKYKDAMIIGTSPSYRNIMKTEIISGRYLSEPDVDSSRNSIVIDNITANKLFPRQDPVGKKITLKTTTKTNVFNVIGVIKNPNPALAYEYSDDFPSIIIMPYTSINKIKTSSGISTLIVSIDNMNNSSLVSKKILHLLEINHNSNDNYTVQESFKELDLVNQILSMFTLIISAIAGISLLVGGIGVMNIMLVSVTERTREIGIRKALGAKKKDIMLQFLTESLIICLIGGLIGILLGTIFSNTIGYILGITSPISIKIILVSFLFSSIVGIFFGIYPAKKASLLSPIDALRYES